MSLMNNQVFGVLLAGIVVAGCQIAPQAVQAQDGVSPSGDLQGAGAPATSAQGASLGAAQDCTNASVNYEDDPNLTPAEKAERMDQALFRSLNHFDACQSAAEGGGGGGGGGAGAGGGGGAGAGAGEGEGTAGTGATGHGTGSVASTGMSGTEKTSAPDSGQSGSGQNGTETSSGTANTGSDTLEPGDFESTKGESSGSSGKNLSNGKVPEDIPSANNDSVLEGQIRQAAMNETDPKIKAQLWNEYRKYKGLPVVK